MRTTRVLGTLSNLRLRCLRCPWSAHPCNIKDVIVYGGMTNSDDSMVEILRATMRNDIPTYKVYESFNTRHTNADGIYIPCKFIKIVPLWYPSFLISTPIYNKTNWLVVPTIRPSIPVYGMLPSMVTHQCPRPSQNTKTSVDCLRSWLHR